MLSSEEYGRKVSDHVILLQCDEKLGNQDRLEHQSWSCTLLFYSKCLCTFSPLDILQKVDGVHPLLAFLSELITYLGIYEGITTPHRLQCLLWLMILLTWRDLYHRLVHNHL